MQYLISIDGKGGRLNDKQLKALAALSDHRKKFVMLYGGSRAGKTALAVFFIRARCHVYPGSRHLVARYSFANAKKTVWLQTMIPQFKIDEEMGLCQIKEQAGMVEYFNGSMVILGGLEPSRIDSILGSEYGTIFVTEANEDRFSDIEKLFSRLNDTTVSAAGKQIIPKFVCDLNPTVDRNWTNVLFNRGLDPITGGPRHNFHEFAAVHFRPEDNQDNLSPGYIESLRNLSPSNRKRFYEGVFGSIEGLVFPFEESVHVVDPFPIPDSWPRGRSIDFGYTHPFVCLWWAYDAANECAYVYREHVQEKWTVNQHAQTIKQWTAVDFPKGSEASYKFTACDHDAEDRATLEEHGIRTVPADKQVKAGIDQVIDLLDHTGKRPRVKVFADCSKLRDGLLSYRWKDEANPKKDREVLKEDDDEADAFRYGALQWFPIVKPFQFRRIEPQVGHSFFT